MKGICGICGKYKLIKRSLKLSIMICDSCRKEDCYLCNRFKPVAVRTKDGKAICNSCFQRKRYHDISKHEICCVCAGLKPIVHRTKAGALCAQCNLGKKIAKCRKCGKNKKIKAKALGFCGACYEKNRRVKKIISRIKQVLC